MMLGPLGRPDHILLCYYGHKLYKALIRPAVVYGSECWVLTENIKQKLLVF